ncbi:MAG: hypothetical protein JNK87_24215 [Bryobacterales bacterium]|nr:hypothetical protein [Bryobacterales bacterium]
MWQQRKTAIVLQALSKTAGDAMELRNRPLEGQRAAAATGLTPLPTAEESIGLLLEQQCLLVRAVQFFYDAEEVYRKGGDQEGIRRVRQRIERLQERGSGRFAGGTAESDAAGEWAERYLALAVAQAAAGNTPAARIAIQHGMLLAGAVRGGRPERRANVALSLERAAAVGPTPALAKEAEQALALASELRK